jgi:hypothetical protein
MAKCSEAIGAAAGFSATGSGLADSDTGGGVASGIAASGLLSAGIVVVDSGLEGSVAATLS